MLELVLELVLELELERGREGERERGREGEREIIEVGMTYITQLLTSTQRLLYIFKLYP